MVQHEIMFAQAVLNEIQRSGDTITLSSLPRQVGWVYPALESRSAQAPAERAPLETDYMSVDKRILALHLCLRQAGYYLLAFFFMLLPVMLCIQDKMLLWQLEQVDDKAAYIFLANCRQPVRRIWNKDDGTGLQKKSKRPRPEPKCFKWITLVCHCDYTLLAGTATRWIVFYGFTADLFSFFSPPTWIRFLSHCYVAWSECGIVFAFELPHKQFICYFSFREHLLLILESSGWLRNYGYVCVFMLCKQYFRLILAHLQY